MKTVRITLALAALFAGMLGGTSADLRAEGPNQCWRKQWEPEGSCSACGQVCGGAGYLCCSIVVG
jgi:hypothetical protein